MKTTIEISDGLLEQAKTIAIRERTTLRALVETGLRQVVEGRRRGLRFQLRDASFGGKGLQPEFRDAGWDLIRGASYEDRGG